MPRYLVERIFPDGLAIPINSEGEKVVGGVVEANSARGVTWIHSYVTTDNKKTFCIYDAPDAEAVRATAGDNSLPVETVTEVRVLDPYFYSS